MCAYYHGKGGAVMLSTSGTGAAAVVAKMTKWSLDMSTDKADATGMGDANKSYTNGMKDVKGKLSFWWNDADDSLFTAADSADGCKCYLYPAGTGVAKYFYGPALLDISISGDMGSTVGIDANLAASGNWGRK
jgi:hypothetical protein